MKVLALDSSGLTASVAIVEDGITVAEYSVNYKKTHSQTLLPMLDEIRRMTELDLSTIDALAIAKGPGSFTGLRIGSATVKGLGLALDIPVAEIMTTDALAYNMYGTDRLVCPIMDARRDQVYTGLYEFLGSGDEYHMETVLPATAMSIDELAEKINSMGRKVVFLGDGVPVFRDRIEQLVSTDVIYASANKNLQSAASVGVLGILAASKGNLVSADEHTPEYLRLSQAERERNEREDK